MEVWEILPFWLAFTTGLRWVWVDVATNVWCFNCLFFYEGTQEFTKLKNRCSLGHCWNLQPFSKFVWMNLWTTRTFQPPHPVDNGHVPRIDKRLEREKGDLVTRKDTKRKLLSSCRGPISARSRTRKSPHTLQWVLYLESWRDCGHHCELPILGPRLAFCRVLKGAGSQSVVVSACPYTLAG